MQKGYICIEDNKPDAISRMQSLTANEKRIEVKTVMTKYPEGAERCLINAVTGRKVNSSMLPADAGCVVDNIDTVVAVYKAVMLGQPLTERILRFQVMPLKILEIFSEGWNVLQRAY